MAELKEADAGQLHQEDVDIKRKLTGPVCRLSAQFVAFKCEINRRWVTISAVQWIHGEFEFSTAQLNEGLTAELRHGT